MASIPNSLTEPDSPKDSKTVVIRGHFKLPEREDPHKKEYNPRWPIITDFYCADYHADLEQAERMALPCGDGVSTNSLACMTVPDIRKFKLGSRYLFVVSKHYVFLLLQCRGYFYSLILEEEVDFVSPISSFRMDCGGLIISYKLGFKKRVKYTIDYLQTWKSFSNSF
jgi:hypothetical protein